MSSLFASINLDSPLALYSLPVIWFTSFYPHTMKVSARLGSGNIDVDVHTVSSST